MIQNIFAMSMEPWEVRVWLRELEYRDLHGQLTEADITDREFAKQNLGTMTTSQMA